MKNLIHIFLLCGSQLAAFAQPSKTELYDLVKKIVTDSTGYENVGDWAVGKPATFPVQWKADKLEMSDDTSINFYRMGTANIVVNGRRFMQSDKPVTWNLMLKGPRMGYSSFSIISSPSKDMQPKYTLDSLFGGRPYTATLIKSCDHKTMSGFYWYKVKIPKKDIVFIKLSWLSLNGNTAVRIDGYDSWSQYSAKLACPD